MVKRVSKQVGALPIRFTPAGAPEVLLVTTRGGGRWVVPKGWPMRGRSDSESAAREAEEEAGAVGRVRPVPIGSFRYTKRDGRADRIYRVVLYRLDVTGRRRRWRERGQREVRWLSPERAARLVAWPDLARIIRAADAAAPTDAGTIAARWWRRAMDRVLGGWAFRA